MKTITTGVPLNHLGQIRKYKLPVSPALSAGVRRVLPHLADSHRVLLLLTVLQCFLFIYKLTLIQHRLSAIALTRGTGRMRLPRQLTREHSLERTGKCFRKSFELRKKEVCQDLDKLWIENMEFGICLFYITSTINMYVLVRHHIMMWQNVDRNEPISLLIPKSYGYKIEPKMNFY